MCSANPGFLELRTGHTIDAPDRRRLCGVCQCGSNISKRLDCNHVSVARLQYTQHSKREVRRRIRFRRAIHAHTRPDADRHPHSRLLELELDDDQLKPLPRSSPNWISPSGPECHLVWPFALLHVSTQLERPKKASVTKRCGRTHTRFRGLGWSNCELTLRSMKIPSPPRLDESSAVIWKLCRCSLTLTSPEPPSAACCAAASLPTTRWSYALAAAFHPA